ncbi:MAG: sugar phosphate nucleotidyltransferase [Clostridiaceae bacterium]|nr:sugar phosphate nucleotidyltransferase [Clostridiaceae bacterium]
MQNTTLVVMAAGIGSRFGKGIKQLTPVGPNGEIIIDYSIYDALEAGFNKVVFIIRKDIEEEFREVIGNRIEQICDVEYAFQEIDNLPEGYSVPNGRTKPWGTGQAVLACKDIVKEPFAVINADDYYGKEAFVKIHNYLVENSEQKFNYCMAGFILKNTLSDNGGVTRGICHIDKENNLIDVEETHNIIKCQSGACIEGTERKVDVESYVSMNMWGLTPEFFDVLDKKFVEFLDEIEEGDIKAEYLIPIIIDGMLKKKEASVKLLETKDKWFGVTYAEDKNSVIESFKELIENGTYNSLLWNSAN